MGVIIDDVVARIDPDRQGGPAQAPVSPPAPSADDPRLARTIEATLRRAQRRRARLKAD